MKTQFQLLLLVSLLIFSIGCKKDEDFKLGFKSINVVTGLFLTDDNGAAIGKWQFPNEKETDIVLYPNPAVDVITLSSQDTLINVWIVPSFCESEGVSEDVTAMSQTINYEAAKIEELQIFFISGSGLSSDVSINLSEFDEGFYKIFVETVSGEIYWRNFYKSNTFSPDGAWNAVLDSACN